MKLLNKTNLNTTNLRIMLYNFAEQAKISTRGVEVEVRKGRNSLRGLCYPSIKRIILWILLESKSQEIAFVWVHELAHLTSRNKRLYAAGHATRAQEDANDKATKITGVHSKEIQWRIPRWRSWWPRCPTEESALLALKDKREKFPGFLWRIQKVSKDKECPWRIQLKKVVT